MLVLLPPSQGKAAPERGRRAGLSTLVYPRLRERRERLIDAVDPGLRTAPAIPAAELYTGVLFAALGLADLPWEGVLSPARCGAWSVPVIASRHTGST